MTNEERHIAVLNRMLESMDVYDSIQPTVDVLDKIRAEINAMSGDIETISDVLDIIDKYR